MIMEFLGFIVMGAALGGFGVGVHFDIEWLVVVSIVVFGIALDMIIDAKIKAAKDELRNERE